MRNILFVGFACAMLAGQATAAEKVVLEADDDYAPYSYVEKGQHKGIYVDFLKKVAEKLAPAYEVSLQPVPWKRGLQNLEKGDSLALFPPYFNKERKFIQPYSTPLFRETVVLFCTDEVMKTPRKNFPDDFAGLTIGINLGFALGEKMVSAAKSGKIKTEEVKGNEANIKKPRGYAATPSSKTSNCMKPSNCRVRTPSLATALPTMPATRQTSSPR